MCVSNDMEFDVLLIAAWFKSTLVVLNSWGVCNESELSLYIIATVVSQVVETS